MKIALFHNLPAGGAKRAVFEQARGLRDRGHTLDAYVLTTANEDFLPLAPLCRSLHSYEAPEAAFSRVAAGLLYGRLTAPFWKVAGEKTRHTAADIAASQAEVRKLDALENVYARMARQIEDEGYDLVLAHHCMGLLSPALLRFLTTPTVYYCHDTFRYVYEWAQPGCEDAGFETERDRPALRKKNGRLLTMQARRLLHHQERRNADNARAATLVLANSWYSREAILRAYGIDARVCYLGVDAGFFSPDPATVRRREVLSVGSFVPNKCHEFVIDAVASIPADRRPVMRIIGYETTPGFGKKDIGPVAQSLLQRARAKDVALVLQQEVSDEALREGYRQAGVLAFAPHLEPFGFVTLEAMACGTPVVGVSEGGLRETIQDGITGFLTDRDPGEFGAALSRVLSDPGLTAEMGRRARESAVQQWSWARSLDRLEHLFQQAVAAKRAQADDSRPSRTLPARDALKNEERVECRTAHSP